MKRSRSASSSKATPEDEDDPSKAEEEDDPSQAEEIEEGDAFTDEDQDDRCTSDADDQPSLPEVDPSSPQISKLMGRLVEQQDTVMRLVQQQAAIISHIGGDSKLMGRLVEQQDTIMRLVQQQGAIISHIIGGSEKNDDSSAQADAQLPEDIRRRRLKLYRAALNGDWAVAKGIYDVYEGEFREAITRGGETALHVAAVAERIGFAKELLKIMNPGDLAQENKTTNSTALFFAAASGNVELAREMMKDNNTNIAMIRDRNGLLPIHIAASVAHKEMVKHLYKQTKDSLKDEDRFKLLVILIETDFYDVALQLLIDFPQLSNYPEGNCQKAVTALHVLARKNLKSSDFLNQNQGGFLSRCFNLGGKDVENERKKQAMKLLVERIWEKIVLLKDSEISMLIMKPRPLIFDAAKQGNFEFLTILIREYPDLVWKFDGRNCSIFHYAVLKRQEDIFKLIYEIGSIKEMIVLSQDKENGNNILHLAGLLAPQDRLNIVSGAALQMQRELLWFKEVKKVIQPSFAEAENREGDTPRALFTKEHKELREEGEKWMKDTATSCMIVATLIATVVFAAAFTVPGGTKGDTGFPFFDKKASFKIFAISDAISLVSSTASIVNFLSILTSRYAEEDFLELLPRKLLFGLGTLFVSIATMMVVFSTTFFIFFTHERLWIAVLVTVIASIPVILFIYQHIQLFIDVLRSTYVSNSLFQKGKSNLFRKEGEASERQMMTNLCNAKLTTQCTCSTNV